VTVLCENSVNSYLPKMVSACWFDYKVNIYRISIIVMGRHHIMSSISSVISSKVGDCNLHRHCLLQRIISLQLHACIHLSNQDVNLEHFEKSVHLVGRQMWDVRFVGHE